MPRSKTFLGPKTPTVVAPTPSSVVAPVVQTPSLMQTMKEGVAFGTGSTLARMMIDRMLSTNAKETQYDTCKQQKIMFEKCLVDHGEYMFCRDQQNAIDECIKDK